MTMGAWPFTMTTKLGRQKASDQSSISLYDNAFFAALFLRAADCGRLVFIRALVTTV